MRAGKIPWGGTFLLILAGTVPAFAARPLSVDDAGTVEVGAFEAEAGYGYEDFEESCRGLSLGLKHGITEKMDLGVGTGWRFASEDGPEEDPEDGPEGMEIGVKWSLLAVRGKTPGVSLAFGFAPGETEYFLNGIVSQPLGGGFTLHLNAGYTGPEAFTDGSVFWGGAFELAVHERVSLMGEVAGNEDFSGKDEDCRSWLLGGNIAVTDFLTLDIGGGTKIAEDPGWFLTGGATWGF